MIATHTAMIEWAMLKHPALTLLITGILSVASIAAMYVFRWRHERRNKPL